jgi:probable rRNA maturation factor
MNKVIFNNADISFRFPHKKNLKVFITKLFVKEKIRLRKLNYIFCSDEYLLKINRQFLKHDFYTDIISFNLGENKEVDGEIYISIERVKENALNLDISFELEMLRVIFHGSLHLCGYKDKMKSEIKGMRAKEDYFIRLYNKSK